MTDCIKLDMDQLRELGDNLLNIHDAFDKAETDSQATADATGDKKLSDAVSDFADAWKLKRSKMLDNIKNMQAMVQGIADTFDEVNDQLEGSLTEAEFAASTFDSGYPAGGGGGVQSW